MENLPTIIGAAVVAAVFIAIIVCEVKKRKSGKGSCSCGCSDCAMKDTCHGADK